MMGTGKLWVAILCVSSAGCTADADEEHEDEDPITTFASSLGSTCDALRRCYPEAQAQVEHELRACAGPLESGEAFFFADGTRAPHWEQCVRAYPDQDVAKAWVRCLQPYAWSTNNCYAKCPATIDACMAQLQSPIQSCHELIDTTTVGRCLSASDP